MADITQESCAQFAPHERHTWFDGNLRWECPGVPESRMTRRFIEGYPVEVPLIKGPTTFTTACTCDSQLPGYHRMDCGVYD